MNWSTSISRISFRAKFIVNTTIQFSLATAVIQRIKKWVKKSNLAFWKYKIFTAINTPGAILSSKHCVSSEDTKGTFEVETIRNPSKRLFHKSKVPLWSDHLTLFCKSTCCGGSICMSDLLKEWNQSFHIFLLFRNALF